METNPHPRPLSASASQKKCPQCGEWTIWQLQAEDRCTHCGALLSTHIQEKEARAQRILTAPTGLFPVNETDGALLKAGKRVLNLSHMVFTAVVGAVIWFITVVVA